jgi:PAS domain S-box-containing protein
MTASPRTRLPLDSITRKAIRYAAQGLAVASDDRVFDELVRTLALALNVSYTLIGTLDRDGEEDMVDVIAMYNEGELEEPFRYCLEGSPCEDLVHQSYRYFPDKFGQQYGEVLIKDVVADGFAGIPLYGSDGRVTGLMVAMSKGPLSDRELTEELLKIFSVRAALELERRATTEEAAHNAEELRLSEDRFRATVDAAMDCIISMDGSGNIIDFNPASERTFGYRREDAIGKPLADLIIPEEMRERHKQGLKRYLESGNGPYLGRRVEVEAVRADGSRVPVELAITVAQGPNGDTFIGCLRDITDRIEAENERGRLEAQLRQAQKMEAIGHLTGGIAHDFNNILTGVNGYVVMAQEWEQQHQDERLHRFLDRIEHSTSRARDLIQQMLLFSRGGRGEARSVSLEPLVRDGVQLLESMLPSSIEIGFRSAPDLPPVMADPVHLEQVLVNLCINARDAMNGSGNLQIELRREICAKPCTCASCKKPMQGEYLVLSIGDTGTGIAPEQVDRIFEPFYSTKDVGKGSGMGLSTVHGIVHEYGGHIQVHSKPGKGARFCVLLPMAGSTNAQAEIGSGAERAAGTVVSLSGRILLAEDDADVREYMVDRLGDWGLIVSPCANAAEALDLLASQPPQDLYLFDYTMPGMNGVELARAVRERDAGARILLYTGYGDELTEKDIAAAGILALVRKPVDIPSFHALLREHLPHS